MKSFVAFLFAVSLSVSAFAADPVKVETKPWDLTINLDWQSHYMFRGYNYQSKGMILQPSAEFSYTVYDKNDVTITPYIGMWNNITDQKAPSDEVRNWSEADVYGGVKVNWKNFEFGVVYTLYTYPNRSQSQSQEIGFTVQYDDSSFWEKTPIFASVNPRIGYYVEMEDRGDNSRDAYFEVGIEPTLKPITILKTPVTFSFPMTVGMSPDGYYISNGKNDSVGFYYIAAKATFPVYTTKTMKVEVTGEAGYIWLQADSVKASNGGDSDDFLARLGVSFKF